jgi:two-component system response regulator MprA
VTTTDPTAASERIAVIDDERTVREMLEIGLRQEGFDVRTAHDSATGVELVRAWEPHCVVLDVMMPKVDGFATIPLLRRLTEAPILMLTARGEIHDRIEGLRVGADDYLAKPFDLGELAIRIRAALRRPVLAKVRHLTFADLTVDLETRSVVRGTRSVLLSAREYDLLIALLRRPRRVFTRENLLDLVWGTDADVTTNSVEAYIHYLRAKIDVSPEPRLIHTVRGAGYTLRESA